MSQPGDIPAKSPSDAETSSPGHSADDTPDCEEEKEEEEEGQEKEKEEEEENVTPPGTAVSGTSSANDMLCTSQTLDDEPLTPEVVAPPKAVVTPRSGPKRQLYCMGDFQILY